MHKILINQILSKYQFSQKQVKSLLQFLQQNNTLPFIPTYPKQPTPPFHQLQIKQISHEYQYVP
ncbi:Tex-like N-terminal domain-containing protein, partial [Staphylococcus haemolyticus]|uniref:Tex-like N-terminal domain-containing protein n=1 Tax=Staphylococcus haemolyticus TaxID=1283 RepID=UPI00374FB997